VSRYGGKVGFANEVKRDGEGSKSAEMMSAASAAAMVAKSYLVA
jgi:hypothetical protein